MKKILLIGMVLLMSGCNSEQVIKEGIGSVQTTSPLLIKYIVGKPDMAYFNAEKRVATRWGLNLKHVFAGSKNRSEIERARANVKASNLEADEFYDKKFGKNWKIRFKEEVYKEKG
jgi:hypothetical protein